jgi:hypothetical protein
MIEKWVDVTACILSSRARDLFGGPNINMVLPNIIYGAPVAVNAVFQMHFDPAGVAFEQERSSNSQMQLM